MTFNSLDALLFMLLSIAAYWCLQRRAWQNTFLLAASVFFYAYGEPIFVLLLLACAATGYLVALGLDRYPHYRRPLLFVGVAVPFLILGLFKYFNFFVDSFHQLFSSIGLPFHRVTLQLALPIGVSFFTFQTVGYVVDVYRRHCTAERNVIDFFLFITFFPQLVAGPIERAHNLLQQIKEPRRVTRRDIVYGVYMLLQGYLKKVVVADNLAPMVNLLFGYKNLAAPLIVVGAMAFAFQIYCDFSGYTDIARGISRILGFRILLNFNQPYRSKNPTEFWHRWHITLSNWFRDYVYIPLGGNRRSFCRTHANIFTTMTLSGMWHGASLNFAAWGAYHGILLIAHKLYAGLRPDDWPESTPLYGTLAWLTTFALTLYGWLLFRLTDFSSITAYTATLVHPWTDLDLGLLAACHVAPYIALSLWTDWAETRLVRIQESDINPRWILGPFFAVLLALIVVFGSDSGGTFIYFRF